MGFVLPDPRAVPHTRLLTSCRRAAECEMNQLLTATGDHWPLISALAMGLVGIASTVAVAARGSSLMGELVSFLIASALQNAVARIWPKTRPPFHKSFIFWT